MDNTYGLYFPITIVDGAPAQPGLLDSIESSIRIILGWQIYTRNWVAQFGSILETLLSSPNTSTTKTLAEIYITKAIETWEKRVIVSSVEIVQDQEYMSINIKGTVRDLKTDFNYNLNI